LLQVLINEEHFSNKLFLVEVYAVIEKIENRNNEYIIYLQDIRSSFKLIINLEFYNNNINYLKIHNELLFFLKVEIRDRQLIILSCEKILEI